MFRPPKAPDTAQRIAEKIIILIKIELIIK